MFTGVDIVVAVVGVAVVVVVVAAVVVAVVVTSANDDADGDFKNSDKGYFFREKRRWLLF